MYKEAFKKAYNNFENRPLIGEDLNKFYVDDFTKALVNEVITTIRITEMFKKILIIGHRGCGKSTILNKAAEELKNEYHIVSFSVLNHIGLFDLDTVDILFVTYLLLLQSVRKYEKFERLFEKFSNFWNLLNTDLKLEQTNINLPGIVSLKFQTEPESRSSVRKRLFGQIKDLQKNITEVCEKIRTKRNKDVLIIIDDLDKLRGELSEKLFFDNSQLLLMPEVKIVYTFPLDNYYSDSYMRIKDLYDDLFMPVVNLCDARGNCLEASQKSLQKLILKRIDTQLIEDRAINFLIHMSGGLLRDLVRFMRDSCKLAFIENSSVITQSITERAVNDFIIDYHRLFDFSKYFQKVNSISQTRKKTDNDSLVYLLRHLFVLEYRHGKKQNVWYEVHPCLKKALEIQNL